MVRGRQLYFHLLPLFIIQAESTAIMTHQAEWIMGFYVTFQNEKVDVILVCNFVPTFVVNSIPNSQVIYSVVSELWWAI